MIGFAIVSALALTLALATIGVARGQEPDLRIAELDCDSDPELVEIKNEGGPIEQGDIAGWQLQSEPSGSEVFELGVLGGFASEESKFIQSGPSASGTFRWGNEAVFRDGDPTDYVRIVDGTGAVVDQVNCSQPLVAASPTPSPAPTPSPEASPAADVPNGGGAPPIPGSALSPAMMVTLGGSMAAAGMAFITRSWRRLSPRPTVSLSSSLEQVTGAPPSPGRPRRSRSRGLAESVGFGLALGALVALITLLVVRRRGV
jgi:hypothetical protein